MEIDKKTARKIRKLKKAEAFVALVKSDCEHPLEMTTNPQHGDAETEGREEKVKVEIITEVEGSPHGMNTPEHTEERSADDVGSGDQKPKLSDDAFKEMKKILRERNKLAMQRPKVFLTLEDTLPFKSSIEDFENDLPPLYPVDLQHLLLYALQGNVSSFKPRWCKLLRVAKVSSVVLIILDGAGYSDFTDDKESFSFIGQSFDSHVEIVCPEQYNCSVDEEIYSVPMSIQQIKKANVKVREDIKKEVADKLKPVKKKEVYSDDDALSAGDKFSRTCLLLSTDRMKQEGYPMPVKTDSDLYKDFVFSKDHYVEVTPMSPLFALDCEMCLTTIRKNELTRVSIVAENGEIVYDTLVKPRNMIINYLTKYSGITKKMLDPVTVTVEDVQRDIKELLPPDAILCGQSLNCDLIALKIFHPYVIDTSVIFNMSGQKFVKAGLKKLTGFFLNRNIQNSASGHCSAEDAIAALDLVKLKLKRGLEFGDATISEVYFPSVESYFLGGKGSDKAANGSSVVTSPGKRPNPDSANHTAAKRLKSSHLEEQLKDKAVTVSSDLKKHLWADSRMKMFSQSNSVHICQSFFKVVIDDAGRTGCMIGGEQLTSKYGKEPIELCPVSSDKEACKSAKQAVQEKEFTWVNFHKFREAVADPETSQESFLSIKQKLDKRVRKVVGKVKDKSLVVVIMTGRQVEGKVVNAGTFVKIT